MAVEEPMSAAQPSSAISDDAKSAAVSDCALDAVLYAPVGFALFLRDQAPNFVKIFAARGRAELSGTAGSVHGRDSSQDAGSAQPDVRRLVSDGIALLRECA